MQTTLVRLGLKKREAEMYLTLLSLGAVPASVIGRRFGIPKSTARYLCLELVKKGFVAMTEKNDAIYYHAEQPQKILQILEHQRWEIDQREEQVRSILDSLLQIAHPMSERPRIRYYEGMQEASFALDELLEEFSDGDEMLSYANPLDAKRDYFEAMPILRKFMQQRMKRKVFNRLITCDTPAARLLQKQDKGALRETRIIPHRVASDPSEVIVCPKKTFIMTGSPQTVFVSVVENEPLGQLQRALFESLWQTLTPAA